MCIPDDGAAADRNTESFGALGHDHDGRHGGVDFGHRGSGSAFKDIYKTCGLLMMSSHAVNHSDGRTSIEPALAEIRDALYDGQLTIRPCNRELLEELRHYHRDDNHKIVKLHDDLISAFRYAYMSRRKGKQMSEIEGIGFGNLPRAHQVKDDRWDHRGPEPKIARGTHFDVFNPSRDVGDFDPFTGR